MKREEVKQLPRVKAGPLQKGKKEESMVKGTTDGLHELD